ncbi:hypothetical protein [Hugenholtzia roseola]|uniref:hypothetical protein n=1 Tax=Hugenholtzia roseola TaxID=1002 RepID=UPI00040797D5|nr:hypothetical protein [Hugenholtzia roseola]
MLSLLRINDPFRLIFPFLLLLLLWFPHTAPLQIEMRWLLVGEKITESAGLYRSVWENMMPLSAWVYEGIEAIVGRSFLTLKIIGLLLLFYQAAHFNLFLIQKDFFQERTYLPAFFYALLGSLYLDELTLTPPLMAMFFLLLVLSRVFLLADNSSDVALFKIGFYIGIATLFYLPSLFYLAWLMVGLSVFRTTTLRQYLLSLIGFLLPLLAILTYFYFTDRFFIFFQQTLFLHLKFKPFWYLSWQSIAFVVAIPLFWFLVCYLQVSLKGVFHNFQIYSQRMMLLWFLVGILVVAFTYEVGSFIFIFFVPILAFFFTHALLLIKKRWQAEIFFWIIALSSLTAYGLETYLPDFQTFIQKNKLLIQQPAPEKKSDKHLVIENKQVWVVGNDLSYYLKNKMATPYLNTDLTKNYFKNLNNYEIINKLYEDFNQNPPEVIIDLEGDAKRLLDKLPPIRKKYEQKDNIYFLKDN